MRFECPSCKKVLMIKDAYAGKTGKCPGCGEKITLPEPDDNGQADEMSPESEALMAAESEAFINGGAAGKPKAGRSPAGIIALVAGLVIVAAGAAYYVLSSRPLPLPDISLYNVDADRYVKRSQALPTEAITAWQKAVRAVTGEYLSSKQIFFKLPNMDKLWQEDAFSGPLSDGYLARVAATPLHAIRDWQAALRRATENEVTAELSDTLFRIVEVDRLFEGGKFNNELSGRLIARLDGLESSVVARWAEALNAGRGQAALTLICLDPLFKEGALDSKSFEKQVRAANR